MVAHNYEQQGKKVIILKPSTDTRSQKGMVESRVGISHACIDVYPTDNIFNIVDDIIINSKLDCILIDECQFLSVSQVYDLVKIADYFNTPIICYGLKNTYVKGELFDGIKTLLYFASSIEEIKSTCEFCNSKATQNLRVVNGQPVYEGGTIHVGDVKKGNNYYISTCRYHYFKPELR